MSLNPRQEVEKVFLVILKSKLLWVKNNESKYLWVDFQGFIIPQKDK